jgi:hypothetical protein
MNENPNVALHRRGHEAFARGDMDTLAELIAENTVWHHAGRSPISGDYEGRDAVFAFFGRLSELTEGTLELEDQFFMGDGDRTVALFRLEGSRGGEQLAADFCEVVRWENGQVAENWGFAFDQHAYDEFWS